MILSSHARCTPSLALVAIALCGATSAKALTITPVFDSSITSLANAATVEAAFTAVADQFDESFSTPVTIKIGVSWGKVNGGALGAGDISSSQSALTGPFSYSTIADAFKAEAAVNPKDANMVSAARNLPKSSPA